MKRLAALVLACLWAVGLTACESPAPASSGSAPVLRVGTLQTDDLLPLWVAEQQGLLTEAGLDVRIETFQSAQEQIAAVTAGQIDAIMTDMVVGAQLSAAGTPMRFVTALQGAPAGVAARAGADITQPADLAGVAAGCSSPTILEYIYERALLEAGVAADQIKTVEIKKLPVRLQMLTAGQIDAAVLPWTLYQLALSQGAVPVVGLAQDEAYTSTVLAFRQAWLDQPGSSAALGTLLGVLDQAVGLINADPDAQRGLLADKANLPAPLDTTYPVRPYPLSGPPEAGQVSAVLDWMTAKGYLTSPLTVEDLVWQS